MLAVITCHFNPCHFKRPIANYWQFRDALKADLHTIELSYDGNFSIPDAIHITGDFATQNMWQKERLLNILISQLPEKYDKIAWLDADVIFKNPNWFEDTKSALNKYDLVQMFERVVGQKSRGGAPGFAWAAKRHTLPLMDTHILGGSDIMMYFAARGLWNTYMLTLMNRQWRLHYLDEAAKAYLKTNGIGCVEGDIQHLYHGTHNNRQYLSRWGILKDHDFDPAHDIRIAENGIWEWSSDKPEMHRLTGEYFASRKEDD